MRTFLVPVLILVLLGAIACAPSPTSETAPSVEITETEILWDVWGVPHIYAPDAEQSFYAQGRAQARLHADLLLRLYGQARGRAAEYWGEQYLDGDRWMHTMGVPARSADWQRAQTPEFGAALEAFARGVTEWAQENLDQIDDEVEVVLPITAEDLHAHVQRVIHFTFIAHPGAVQNAHRGWTAHTAQSEVENGSNAWAIAPSRTENGHAILVANPHLSWSDLFTFTELHLITPEMNLSGTTLVGMPGLSIGFNDFLGWTHTVNTFDGADLYELQLDGDGYRFDDEVRPFEQEEVVLKVRGEDDAFNEEVLKIRRSVHGPVVAESGEKALALRVAGLDAPHLAEQYWQMGKARNFDEFVAAQSRLQMPLFTTMYADRDGRILHLFGGRTPKRSEGDWATWRGVVPGTGSENLWTETHAYEELPKVIDPPTGWLQNANDPPWTTTFPPAIDADDYPAYMAPREMYLRPQRSVQMLQEDESFTFEEVVAAKHSSRSAAADRLLDDLTSAVEAHPSEKAQEALEALTNWDRAFNAESRGGALFEHWFEKVRRPSPYAEPWNEDDPLATPDGLADPAAAVAALEQAATEIEAAYGAIDVAWGEVHRLARGEVDHPADGGPSRLGIFRVTHFGPPQEGRRTAFHGDTYVAVVEFSDPVRAEALLSYGNSTQPGSPHNGDQLEMYSRQELRPVWRERGEIEANLKERETL